MTELAYDFFAQYDGCGEYLITFEEWLSSRETPREIIRIELTELCVTLNQLAMSAP